MVYPALVKIRLFLLFPMAGLQVKEVCFSCSDTCVVASACHHDLLVAVIYEREPKQILLQGLKVRFCHLQVICGIGVVRNFYLVLVRVRERQRVITNLHEIFESKIKALVSELSQLVVAVPFHEEKRVVEAITTWVSEII